MPRKADIRYTFHRVDTATRTRRLEIQAMAPGLGLIDTTRPQYVILDAYDGQPADWPLIDSYEEAREVCIGFNTDDDDDVGHSEARWLARMSGDMDA